MSAQVFARSLILALAGAALGGSGCSHDWDFFDPRLGAGGDATGGAPTGGSPSAGGGGNPSTGGGGSAEGGAPSGGGGAGPGGGAQGGGGAGPVLHSYDATVADCIDPAVPDPDACALENGGTRMTADSQVDVAGGERRIYLRFDLDGAIAAGPVDSVVLRMTVPIFAGSESNASGSLWEVAPFTRTDLFAVAPAEVGGSPLVMDLGPVVQGQVVDFELPTSAVAPSTSVYFSIRTTSTNGVDYFNLTGTSPPELLITTL